ncbi:IclR family transcriptional regulator [Ectobacillus ponti]|uniref:Glycerol operon regulatory protein n=1 Tax=Ectobacillus ponti TaxID=2961894 RepID=A0AA42BPK9_9BACI|nr:IclR family transcriptional regulator [Ectobacillus ponti]MCP8968546.1 IclR family transcriptional regulator [Ectobacillus ponti]
MVQSIDRAMQIISLLSSDERKAEWSISELSGQTGLPVSTMHRLLQSLMQHELVAQNADTKRYKLGYRWLELGLRTLNTLDLRAVARPAMERLVAEVEENAFLNIISGRDGIVIEKVESPLKIRVDEQLGTRIPLTVGAPNKVLLAFMPQEEREAVMKRQPAEQQAALEQLLHQIREQGYAISISEKTEDTAAVAAPVFDHAGRAAAAVSIGIPGFRFTEDRIPAFIQQVQETAAQISFSLGQT